MDKFVVTKTKRKTISVEITSDVDVIVRAPKWMSDAAISGFVEKNRSYIEKNLARMKAKKQSLAGVQRITATELEELYLQAKQVIPERVKYYAPLVGVDYGRITIRRQHTRWGSCSSKGNLNFNVALMKVPFPVLDYVVVHELCHRIEMNHSRSFWLQVERVFPDYKNCKKWLKDNGERVMIEVSGS